MTKAELTIICYSAWAGAEASYRFVDKQHYDAARAFLDKLVGDGIDRSNLPVGYRDANAYYFIEGRHRDVFVEFMRRMAHRPDVGPS